MIESYAEEGCDEAINAQLEVDSCLEMLSNDQQTVLNLYYHQGFNTREIAVQGGWKVHLRENEWS